VDGGLNRGEIRLAHVGRKRRPVLLLTRSEVMDVRELVTVAEVTTSIRNIAAEVSLDDDETGLDRPSVVNCDGLHTIDQSSLGARLGTVSHTTMDRVCWAIGYALGCS
jgi:mRNA-degrading endonuclease toxin of MazEF toxin-antitoxin module